MATDGGSSHDDSSSLHVTYRDRDTTGNVQTHEREIDPAAVGIVVVDTWNWHWCKTAEARLSAMIPRLNYCLDHARDLGMQVFLCPTDVADNYVGYPQRERALAVERYPLPEPRCIDCPDPPGGGCMCGEHSCLTNYGWDGIHPDLRIRTDDLIVRGETELYSLCQRFGLEHLWFAGVHTNMCVLNKPIGMRNMMEYNVDCALVRDLQDSATRYDPRAGVTPDTLAREVVAHFERHLAPTLDAGDVFSGRERTADSPPPGRVHITPWGRPERPHLFAEEQQIVLSAPRDPTATVHYTTDTSEPTENAPVYDGPLTVEETTTVRAIALDERGRVSTESVGRFSKHPGDPPAPDVSLSELPAGRLRHESNVRHSPVAEPESSLVINEREFDGGYSATPPSCMAYETDSSFDRFVALVGIDDSLLEGDDHRETAQYSHVRVSVFIDGDRVTESPHLRIGCGPWPIDVGIPDASEMVNLVVTPVGEPDHYGTVDIVRAGFVLDEADPGVDNPVST